MKVPKKMFYNVFQSPLANSCDKNFHQIFLYSNNVPLKTFFIATYISSLLHVNETPLELFYHSFTPETPVQTQTHTDKYIFLYVYDVCTNYLSINSRF